MYTQVIPNAGLRDAKEAVEAGASAPRSADPPAHIVIVANNQDARAAARAAATFSRVVHVEAHGTWVNADGATSEHQGTPVTVIGSIWITVADGTLLRQLHSSEGAASWLTVGWDDAVAA